MRKLICLISVLLLVLTLLPAAAMAEPTASGIWGGVRWEFEVTDTGTGNGTLTFIPIDEGRQTDPKTNELYPKGYIKEAVSYNSSGDATAVIATPWSTYASKVTKLVLQDGITGIGSWMLQKMPIQGDLFIPATVIYIGYEAMTGNSFSSLTFESGSQLKCIACAAFKDNTNLTSVELPSGLSACTCMSSSAATVSRASRSPHRAS